MKELLNDNWINERQWEYYSIQIHIILSNKINEPQQQELVNIYNTFRSSKKIVPIQLQEYINLLSLNKNNSRQKTYSMDLVHYFQNRLI